MPHSQPMPVSPPETNADDFPMEQLKRHRGHWVAFSTDGQRLIASCPTLAGLDAAVRAAGEDPEEVLLERIPLGDSILSGSELS